MESAPTAPSSNPPPAGPTLAQIRAGQNFQMAIVAGLGAALGGAILWAIVTVVTNSELGLMAIAVGYLVGQAIKAAGKGVDQKFGYLGAACGFLGCAIGNVLSAIVFYAQYYHLELADVVGQLSMPFLIDLMTRFFQPIDLLFYAIGVYEGYRLSFKYKLK